MVAGVNFVINLAVIRREVIGAQNVVNPEIKTFPIIWQTESPSGLSETVRQSLGYHMTGVRNGIVVEVTADDGGVLTVRLDILVDRLRSYGTQCIGLT